jgi:hypothetical protein
MWKYQRCFGYPKLMPTKEPVAATNTLIRIRKIQLIELPVPGSISLIACAIFCTIA